MECSSCHERASPGAEHCRRCGARLGLGAYTPRYLTDKVLTARSAVEGERKHVTVLFCDLVGSTSIAARIGADAMHELLDAFFELGLDEVHRFEGTINQFLGDGFMALFGAPVAHEDHPRRAVLAASAILRRLKRAPSGDLEQMVARFGINSGPVVVGKIGNNLRLDYTAMGETTHVAARLQALAEPASILIGESTHRALRGEFACQPLGPRSVKGLAAPLLVYKLAADKDGPEERASALVNRSLKAPTTPFVGRHAELETLRAWTRRATQGSGGVVCIVGEPGIGKSRLLAEAQGAGDSRPLWLHAHGVSFGHHIGYLPFVEMLRALFGIAEQRRGLESWAAMEWKASGLLEGAPDWLPYLGELLGVDMPPSVKSLLAHVDNEAMGRQIFAACRQLFTGLCRKQPVVLVLDDYQWFDGSSTKLVEHLLPLVHAMPLTLFIASRSGSPTLERLRAVLSRRHTGGFAELFLGPHSQGESVQLIRHLVEDDTQLQRLVLDKAGGSAFFIEEVIRALAETGVLVRSESGRWRVAGGLQQPIAIPDGIHGVIAARIDRLDEDVKQVLKLAAVVGRSFLFRVLGAIADAADELERSLGELDHLHLVRQRRRIPELEYAFTHALVQEVTYNSILVRRRKLLHLRVAQSLEGLFAERLEEFYGLLAYHYTRAEEWKRAHEYLVLAGDHSGRMAADAEALANYKEALAAYERAFGREWDPLQRASLARKMGEAFFRRGEFDDAASQLRHALAVLGARPVPRSRVAVRFAILVEGFRQWVRLFRAPRTNKRDAADAKERYRIYEVMGWIDFFIDRERMFLDSLYALHSAQAYDLLAEAAQAQAGVAIALDMLPWRGAAAVFIERATCDAERSGHPRALAYATFARGIHAHFIEGNVTGATAMFEQSVDVYRRIGEVRGAGAAASCWLHGHLLRGEFALCASRAETEAAIAADTGDQQVRAWFEGHLMYIGFVRGDTIEEVVRQADRNLAVFQAIPDYSALAQTKALISLCYLAQGQRSTALRVAELTLAILEEHQVRGPMVPYVLGWLADSAVAVLAARSAAASGDEQRIASYIGRELLRSGRRTREGRVCALRWRGAVAWASGRRRRARQYWRMALLAAEALCAHFETARTWLDIGRFSADADALGRAEALFRAMGATVKADEAHILLKRSA